MTIFRRDSTIQAKAWSSAKPAVFFRPDAPAFAEVTK
jgi:hypothetical protein